MLVLLQLLSVHVLLSTQVGEFLPELSIAWSVRLAACFYCRTWYRTNAARVSLGGTFNLNSSGWAFKMIAQTSFCRAGCDCGL